MDLQIANDISQAKELESTGDLEGAAKLYEDAIKHKTLDEHPYNRLMIIYRKLKRPRDELNVIKKGLSVFEGKYIKKSKNKKLADLSKALMKSSGLVDKKGQSLYFPEPITRWRKRKELVQSKLNK